MTRQGILFFYIYILPLNDLIAHSVSDKPVDVDTLHFAPGTSSDEAKQVINEMKRAFQSLFPSAKSVRVKYAVKEPDRELRLKESGGKKLFASTKIGVWQNTNDSFYVKL